MRLAGLSLAMPICLLAQNPRLDVERLRDSIPVYEITANRCNGASRVQSGVLIEGFQGIVTALHGVVGCREIVATRDHPADPPIRFLRITKVDVARDIALLSDPEPSRQRELARIRRQGTAPLSSVGPRVRIVGHPGGRDETTAAELTVNDTRRSLAEAVRGGGGSGGSRGFEALRSRKSPSVDIRVLDLNGAARPGHSGAAVVNDAGRVIAIGSGGIASIDVGWAIPVEDLQFVDAADSDTALVRLAESRLDELFAVEESTLRTNALYPSLSTAAGTNSSDGELRIRVQAPLVAGAVRLQWYLSAGVISSRLTRDVVTLPNLPPRALEVTEAHSFVELGTSLYWFRQPRGAVDPYIRAGGGVTMPGSLPRLDTGLGIDLPAGGAWLINVEAAWQSAQVSTDITTFNRYGNADAASAKRQLGGFRLFAGVGRYLDRWK